MTKADLVTILSRLPDMAEVVLDIGGDGKYRRLDDVTLGQRVRLPDPERLPPTIIILRGA